jgi:hypothetical protein
MASPFRAFSLGGRRLTTSGGVLDSNRTFAPAGRPCSTAGAQRETGRERPRKGGVDMRTLPIAAAAGVAGAVAWLGLRVRPRPAAPPEPAGDVGDVELPSDLPEPVARYYRAVGVSDGRARRVDTFALWGRARMKRAPLPWLPVAFWSEHRVGWSARQLLAVTWWSIPVLRGSDTYVGGRGEMRIGRGIVRGPEIDQGENLYLWAEAALVPSAIVARPGVRWEAIDTSSARLRVPSGAGDDELTFTFDDATGFVRSCRALRFRQVGQPRSRWLITYQGWRFFADSGMFPSRITVTWEDDGSPWFVLDVDGVAVNVEVGPGLSAGPIDEPAPVL